jgi:hypothetical protein
LADDAQARNESGEAVEYLERLAKVSKEPADKIATLLRQADITAEGLDDAKAAIELYERVLSELGAVVPTPSLLIEESELPGLDGITATFVATHGPVLRATTAALLTVPAEKRAAHV